MQKLDILIKGTGIIVLEFFVKFTPNDVLLPPVLRHDICHHLLQRVVTCVVK
jgi:hypothetical protein